MRFTLKVSATRQKHQLMLLITPHQWSQHLSTCHVLRATQTINHTTNEVIYSSLARVLAASSTLILITTYHPSSYAFWRHEAFDGKNFLRNDRHTSCVDLRGFALTTTFVVDVVCSANRRTNNHTPEKWVTRHCASPSTSKGRERIRSPLWCTTSAVGWLQQAEYYQ